MKTALESKRFGEVLSFLLATNGMHTISLTSKATLVQHCLDNLCGESKPDAVLLLHHAVTHAVSCGATESASLEWLLGAAPGSSRCK
jgi:hypothetical protein